MYRRHLLRILTLAALGQAGCTVVQVAPTATAVPPTPSPRPPAAATPRPTATPEAPTATSRPPTATATATPSPTATRPTATTTPPPPPPRATVRPTQDSSGLPPEIVHGPAKPPHVALTLDAGAGAEPAKTILTTLAERKVRLTFFLTGKWAEENPDLVRRIHGEGHEIANHSYSHPDFRELTDSGIVREIAHTEEIMHGLVKVDLKPWFRFPFGARDARVRKRVAALGYTSVFWTFDTLDSVSPTKTPQFLIQRVRDNVTSGAIVLAHVGSGPTAAALPKFLDTFADRGLAPVTMTQLMS